MTGPPPAERPRRRQIERREASRERLHRALAQLIGEQGYARTTAAQIGERAGFSRSMVRDTFGSKLDLFIDYAAATYPSDQDAPLPPTAAGLDRVLHTVDRVLRFAEQDPVILRASYMVMFETVASSDPLARLVRAGHAPFEARRARAITEGIADGSIRPDVDPWAEAELLRAEGMGLAYEAMLGLTDRPLVERLALWRDRVQHRLTPEAGGRPRPTAPARPAGTELVDDQSSDATAEPPAGRVRTNDERREGSAASLRRALAEFICEQGYHATTNAQIGERAGFSRNMVHDRFGSKEALLVDLVLRASGAMVVDPVAWPSGLDRALAAAEQLRAYAAAEPVTQRASFITIFEAVAPGHPLAPVVRDAIESLHDMFAGFLVDGIADGSIRPDVDPAVETPLVQAQILGTAFDCAAGLGSLPFPARMAEQVARIRDGLEAAAPPPAPIGRSRFRR